MGMNLDGHTFEYDAGEALSEGMWVTVSTGTTVIACDAVTEKAIGIVMADAASGAKVTVQLDGRYNYARVDGSGTPIVAGDHLSPSAVDGVAVIHAGTATHTYIGKALVGATTATRIPVLILDSLPAEA